MSLVAEAQGQRFPRYAVVKCKIMGPPVIGLLTCFESGLER